MTDRLDDIESKIAFLELANSELSDTVYRQRLALEALERRIETLVSRLEAAQQAPTAYTLEDEKPPHY